MKALEENTVLNFEKELMEVKSTNTTSKNETRLQNKKRKRISDPWRFSTRNNFDWKGVESLTKTEKSNCSRERLVLLRSLKPK